MPSIPKNIKKQSIDMKEAYGLLGSKLGFYITSLAISDETKDAMYDMLAHMSLEQLERFVAILEAHYLNESTNDMNKRFSSEFSHLQEAFDTEKVALNIATKKKIDDLTTTL